MASPLNKIPFSLDDESLQEFMNVIDEKIKENNMPRCTNPLEYGSSLETEAKHAYMVNPTEESPDIMPMGASLTGKEYTGPVIIEFKTSFLPEHRK